MSPSRYGSQVVHFNPFGAPSTLRAIRAECDYLVPRFLELLRELGRRKEQGVFMNVHDKIDALDPETGRLFDALIDLLLGEKLSFFRHTLGVEDPNEYPTGADTAAAQMQLINWLCSRRVIKIGEDKILNGRRYTVRVRSGGRFRFESSCESLGFALGRMALNVAADDKVFLGDTSPDQNRLSVEAAIDMGQQLEAERLAEMEIDDDADDEIGGYKTARVYFSTGDIEPGSQSAVIATAGGAEQIRIDADGSVFVKGEKWGEVTVPEKEKP